MECWVDEGVPGLSVSVHKRHAAANTEQGLARLGAGGPGRARGYLPARLLVPRPRSQELMATQDRINASMGRGTVRLARVSAQGGRAMKQERRSSCYTSCWGHCRWCVERLCVVLLRQARSTFRSFWRWSVGR